VVKLAPFQPNKGRIRTLKTKGGNLKKARIFPLLCIFIFLVFLDFKLALPIALEFLYGTPMSREQSVLAMSLESTATPTPFQPVWNDPVPATEVVNQPTLSLPTSTPEIISEPSLPDNPYDFKGIRFDGSDTISIVFYPISGGSFPVSFDPIIPVNNSDDYKPGMLKAGVWADDLGNITINPHSGCFRYSAEYVWTELEGEYLRRHLEGGECNDVLTNFSDEQMSAQIEELKKALVVMSENGSSVELTVVGGGVIKYENLGLAKSLDPTELAQLIGIPLDARSIVIVTSGRDLNPFHKPWYSGERLIIVLK